MTEADIHELLVGSRQNLQAIFATLITINFTMVAGAYYFLNRAGLMTKVAAYGVYLMALATLFVTTMVEVEFTNAASATLQQLKDQGETLSPMAHGAVGHALMHNALFLVLGIWIIAAIGMGYFIFFYHIKEPRPYARPPTKG